jgi:amino acid transporter
MSTLVKRLLVGRPLATRDHERERLPKWTALATFSSDAISSTAYATEEILFVTAAGSSSLALALDTLVPIAVVVAVLLAIVVFSYRQTIFAYPSGGGSYIVSRENLGAGTSLVAAASLLIDYTLTVAVSVSAGVAALVSIPAWRGLGHHRVLTCLAVIAFITLANLRGARQSGRLFAVPTYTYILALGGLVLWGLGREAFGGGLPTVAFEPAAAEVARQSGGSLGLFMVLRGSHPVQSLSPASRPSPTACPPSASRSRTTPPSPWSGWGRSRGRCSWACRCWPTISDPSPATTRRISQMARIVVGQGLFYWILQFATACILVLAANTAYADFPRLVSLVARDGYLPHQLANLGDRLVYSNGVLCLATAAAALLVVFGGRTNALIPLYAVGVFASFTLSQSGMVVHHRRVRQPGWRRGAAINAIGAAGTLGVTLIVAVTKFTIGAWVPIVAVPAVIVVFRAIRAHYDHLAEALAVGPADLRPIPVNHTVVVLVARVHKGVLKALAYAKSLHPQHLVAVYVADNDDTEAAAIQGEWERLGLDVPLEIVASPYWELAGPVLAYLDELDRRWDNDTITVILPEFVVRRWYEQLLHNKDALLLKARLLLRPNTVVISVPYHVDREPLPGTLPQPAPPGPKREAIA